MFFFFYIASLIVQALTLITTNHARELNASAETLQLLSCPPESCSHIFFTFVSCHPTFSTSGWVIKSVPPQLAISSGSTLRYITAIIIHGRSCHLRHFPSKTGKTDQCAESIIVFIVFLSQTFHTVICLHTAAMFSQWVLHPFIHPLSVKHGAYRCLCNSFIILYEVCSF